MYRILTPIAILSLTACGVVTSASPTLPVVPSVSLNTGSGAGLAGKVLASDPTGPITSITYNGTPIPGVVKIDTGSSSYGQAQEPAADGTSYDVVAFSDDGRATPTDPDRISASTIATGANSPGGFGQIATYARSSTSILPTIGSGTYNGSYRGTIGSVSGGNFSGGTPGAVVAVQGTATLNANFGSSPTIGGTISSRQIIQSNGSTGASLGGLTLDSTAIDNHGQFASTVSGSLSGAYEGLIGGVNGTGVAGALNVDHAGGFTELGVFTGTN